MFFLGILATIGGIAFALLVVTTVDAAEYDKNLGSTQLTLIGVISAMILICHVVYGSIT